ncbi:Saccharopine dehydrogenase NADP binding domain-containing protein [Rhizobium sp. NFR07]|nr:Saccharopine dehydrogenase NADP binding domain-containing protein [Rhizobium sp. NFR07]
MTKLMIYGATGYTGRMTAEHARAAGTPLVLAGRSKDTLSGLAAELGVEHRVFGLSDNGEIDEGLADISALLNCAGPFLRTAEPLMRAAIRNRVHYLDTAAELDSYRLSEALDDEAKAAGTMLMPGGGGSVAMLGILAGYAVGKVSDPRKIEIALRVAGGLSRGSAISAVENVTTETLARVDGKLVGVPADGIRKFDFGRGEVDCFPVTLPDLITIWRATGVPDVETFVQVTGWISAGRSVPASRRAERRGPSCKPIPGGHRGHQRGRSCDTRASRHGQRIHLHGDGRGRGRPARIERRISSRLPCAGSAVRQRFRADDRQHHDY